MFLLFRILFVTLLTSSVVVNAFSFTAGTPSECGDLSVSWTGGTAPYQLLIIPAFGVPRNVSIPASAFTNGKGSFSTQLAMSKGSKFLLTMSDATGFGTGGSTNVMIVGPSAGVQCNTASPNATFQFHLDSALVQCRPYPISDYSRAVQPVTIMGVIPGGTSFVLNPPVGPDTFEWTANVASGTFILFLMVDSQGNQGGSSDFKLVGTSDDSTCLDSHSPSSTLAPTSTTTGSPSSTSSTSSSSTSSVTRSGTPIGAIAGSVIGALIFLAVVITLGLFFLRRKRDNWGSGNNFIRRTSPRLQSDVDLTYDPSRMPPAQPYTLSHDSAPLSGSQYSFAPGGQRDPFLDTQSATSVGLPSRYRNVPLPSDFGSQYGGMSSYPGTSTYQTTPPHMNTDYPGTYHQSSNSQDPFNPPGSQSPPGAGVDRQINDRTTNRDSMSTAQRKAMMAGVSGYKPSRFIVHTDVDDELPPPNEDEVVELPPQYSERRGAPRYLSPAPEPRSERSSTDLPYARDSHSQSS